MQRHTLQEHRDRWCASVCEGILDRLGDVGQRLRARVRPELGPELLVAALVASRVATRVARADERDDVVDAVFAMRVLRPEASTELFLTELVDTVEMVMSGPGLPGTERWNPDVTFLMLLEFWAPLRDEDLDDGAFAAQLARHWETTDRRALPYLADLDPFPLADYSTLTEVLESDGRPVVQALVARAWTGDQLQRRREALISASDIGGIEHLRALAVDHATSATIANLLGTYAQEPHLTGEARGIASDAARLVEDHRTTLVNALNNLSVHECNLLSADPDRHFQTACLEAFVGRFRSANLRDPVRSARGTFGPLPWWRLVATPDTHEAVVAMAGGDHGMLAVRHDAQADEIVVDVLGPDREPVERYDYALYDVADTCELLLLGRRERLGIDTHGSDGRALGTVVVELDDSTAQRLREITTAALREMLSVGDDYVPHETVYREVEYELSISETRSWVRPSRQWTS